MWKLCFCNSVLFHLVELFLFSIWRMEELGILVVGFLFLLFSRETIMYHRGNPRVLFDSGNVFFKVGKLNPKAIPTTGWKYSNSGWRDAPQLNVRGREWNSRSPELDIAYSVSQTMFLWCIWYCDTSEVLNQNPHVLFIPRVLWKTPDNVSNIEKLLVPWWCFKYW